MILADCHLHTCHSADSKAPMEDMIQAGIKAGLSTMCFTEHNDFDFPDSPEGSGSDFVLNVDSYLYDYIRMKEQYNGQIKLLFGVELGLQPIPSTVRSNAILARSYDFDFIIGSLHVCDGMDPYYPAFFEGKSDEEAYHQYFTELLTSLRKFDNYDVCGHLDYVVRYGASRDTEYSYDKYKDILDKILAHLVENGKGLELNTGGIRHGMRDFNPCMDILKRFHALGGEIITIGSDSHYPEYIGAHLSRARDVLTECGFRYYSVFEKRVPEFLRL